MITFLLLVTFVHWHEPPIQPDIVIDCERPGKAAITVPCKPGEGCSEKWIFVSPDEPRS